MVENKQLSSNSQDQQSPMNNQIINKSITTNNTKSTKKRKAKSKNKSQTFNKKPDSISIEQPIKNIENSNVPNVPQPITPPLDSSSEFHKYKSPRKEAILRYKQTNGEQQQPNLRNQLKSKTEESTLTTNNNNNNNNSNNNSNNNNSNSNSNNNMPEISLNMDEKVTLFKYKSSKILKLSNSNNSTGSLLAHGEFEIFQLHKGDVTYLSCGSQFIYPLLPKIKIFRINFNQFLLPLVNPERYWKIFINSEEQNVLNNLQFTLERNVQYLNLQEETNINLKPKELEEELSPKNFLSTEIPDSPPSAPISPHHNNLDPIIAPILQPLPPPQYKLNKKSSLQSISTNLACLELNHLLHPKPKRSNPYQTHNKYITPIDERSDSSMDSLLDEFEENINKSVKYHSRPVSRVQSIKSVSNHIPNYSRGYYFHHKIDKDEEEEKFRSRRSSRSELYTNESGWMEPNIKQQHQHQHQHQQYHHPNYIRNGSTSRIPKSRSNYSINSTQSFDLNNIYKSIIRNNHEPDSKSIKSMSRLPTISANVQSDVTRKRESIYKPKSEEVKLNSNEIYNLLSSKPKSTPPPIKRSPSFTQRLFGW
ncbi:unnamed protein product [Candida verbasci]|uniref:Inheritance of peroxisomes protein 1 n=1 Tax=Candida verbasci TaxID=1227364 RepID=A0A9W4U0W3_9ASCO|nr:unnamed protein product [Candida verbasci]